MYSCTVGSVQDEMISLIEAIETHGKLVNINFANLPKSVKDKIIAQGEKEGVSKDQIEAMMAAADMESDKADDQFSSGSQVGRKFSMQGQDAFEGIYTHQIELYNKEQDEAILNSKDIVKAYNATIDADFKKAVSYLDTYKKIVERAEKGSEKAAKTADAFDRITRAQQGSIGPAMAALNALDSDINDEDCPFDKNDIKKIICEAVYRPSEDPEEIRKIIKMRIEYNNAMIAMFRTMLNTNYAILGMTKDEALALSTKMESPNQKEVRQSIKEIKDIVSKNAQQFKKGNSYDLRKLGLGVMLMTEEDVGNVGRDVTIDRMIQLLSQYDCIVVGHGSSMNKKTKEYLEKMEKQVDKHIDDAKAKDRVYQVLLQKYKDRQDKEENAVFDKLTNVRKAYLQAIDTCNAIADERMAVIKDIHDRHMKEIDSLDKSSDSFLEDLKRYSEEYDKLYDKIGSDYDKKMEEAEKNVKELSDLTDKILDSHSKDIVAIDDKYKGIIHKLEDRININQKDTMKWLSETRKEALKQAAKLNQKYKSENRWLIQPIKTMQAGPFEDVNDLLRYLYKEGFRNIMLVACNPGGHSLDPDLKEKKDLKVHYAQASLLSESVNIEDTTDDYYTLIESTCDSIESDLLSICESNEIWYQNMSLVEMTVPDVGLYYGSLTEGTLKTMWQKLKELAKRALAALVALFKKIVEFVKNLLDKIKGFFKKIFGSNKVEKNFSGKIRTSYIMVESAGIKEVQLTSWSQLESSTLRACDAISKKIQETERKQVENMKQLERFAEQQENKINESYNSDYDKLVGMIL